MVTHNKNYIANLESMRIAHQAQQHNALPVLKQEWQQLLQKQDELEKKRHKTLAQDEAITKALNASETNSKEYAKKRTIKKNLNTLCTTIENNLKKNQDAITALEANIKQLEEPTTPDIKQAEVALATANDKLNKTLSSQPTTVNPNARKTLPSRFDRAAKIITIELDTIKGQMRELEEKLKQHSNEVKKILAIPSSSDKNDEPTPSDDDIKVLRQTFEDLNQRIEKKQQKTGLSLLWKPIYNLFRQLFGIERKITQLTKQQELALPIFKEMTQLITNHLQLETHQIDFQEQLQHTLDDGSHLKEMATAIQKKLTPYCTTTLTSFFSTVPPLQRKIASITKALSTFLSEPSENNLSQLSAQMLLQTNANYLDNEDFAAIIKQTGMLYQEIADIHNNQLELKQHHENLQTARSQDIKSSLQSFKDDSHHIYPNHEAPKTQNK